MNLSDATDYLASALVVIGGGVRDLIPLRLAALGNSIALLFYRIVLRLAQVWRRHEILSPVDGRQPSQAIWQQRWRPDHDATSYRKPHDDKKAMPGGSHCARSQASHPRKRRKRGSSNRKPGNGKPG